MMVEPVTCQTCGGSRRIHIVAGCTQPAHDRDCPTCVGWPIGGGVTVLAAIPAETVTRRAKPEGATTPAKHNGTNPPSEAN